MKAIKKLPILVTVALLATTVAGCSKNNSSSDSASSKDSTSKITEVATPKGQFPIASQDVTLNFYASTDVPDFHQKNYKDNVRLNQIHDDLGINLDFTFLPNSAEAKTKITLSFASSSYVDGAMLSPKNAFSRSDIVKYGVNEGYLVPLNSYIDKYSTNLKNILEKKPEYRSVLTAPDGNIYGLPDINENGALLACPKMFINKQWLKNLGLKAPTTTKELHDVLVAFRDNDPNKNGVKDEIPMTGSISTSCSLEYWLMNSFIDCPATASDSSPRNFLIMNDKGEVDFAANKAEYLDGLKYMNELYNEGLIDPANFTQKQDALKQEVNQKPDVNVVGAFCAGNLSVATVNTSKLGSEYEVLAPVKGPNGVQFQSYNPYSSQVNGFSFAVFDTCKNPDVAFRVADYLLQPTPSNVTVGTEGVTYEKLTDSSLKNFNGGQLLYKFNKLDAKATQEQKDAWYMNYPNFLRPISNLNENRLEATPEPTPENIAQNQETFNEYQTKLVEQYFPKTSLPRDIFMANEQSTTKFNELFLSINQCVQTNTAKFITGARPLTEWDNYLNELNGYGLKDYIQIYSDSYKANTK